MSTNKYLEITDPEEAVAYRRAGLLHLLWEPGDWRPLVGQENCIISVAEQAAFMAGGSRYAVLVEE